MLNKVRLSQVQSGPNNLVNSMLVCALSRYKIKVMSMVFKTPWVTVKSQGPNSVTKLKHSTFKFSAMYKKTETLLGVFQQTYFALILIEMYMFLLTPEGRISKKEI